MPSKVLFDNVQPLVERVRTDVTWLKSNTGSISCTRDALTHERLAKHLNGGPARGCCPIKNGESTTRVALFDLDAHDKTISWVEMSSVANRLAESMEVFGLNPIAFRSSGGHGIHLFMIWDEPQDAYSVRKQMAAVLDGIGFAPGTRGVEHKEIEIFPKQDSVRLDGFGNQFILPLAGESRPICVSMLGLELMARDYPVDWPVSEAVIEKSKELYAHIANHEPIPITKLRSALQAIDSDAGHDEWVRVLMGLHYETAGGADGLDLALEWSSEGDKYQGEDEIKQKWSSFKRSVGGEVVTGQYILNMARDNDWVDDTLFLPSVKTEAPLPSMIRDKNGRIEAHLNNMLKAVGDARFAKRRICYDSFKDEIVWSKPNEQQYQTFRDTDYTMLQSELEFSGFKPITYELLRRSVHHVSEQNTIDTAIEWLNQLTWDGVPRIKTFLHTYFSAEASEYGESVSQYLWSALAGRVLEPGVKADMVPILVGDQGVGKSIGVAALVPAAEFATEISFSEKDDDLSRKMRGRLIAEIGELRGLHTREMTSIKQFVTKTHENWVPKFKEFSTNFPRRLVFVGTTNEDQFLADSTGNRRWLPIRVGDVSVDAIKRDVLQLWAEAAELFKENGVMFDSASRLAISEHAEYEFIDSWEESISTWLHQINPITQERPIDQAYIVSQEVLVKGLGYEPRNILRRDEMRLANVLKAMGYMKRQIRVDGNRKHVFAKVNTDDV